MLLYLRGAITMEESEEVDLVDRFDDLVMGGNFKIGLKSLDSGLKSWLDFLQRVLADDFEVGLVERYTIRSDNEHSAD